MCINSAESNVSEVKLFLYGKLIPQGNILGLILLVAAMNYLHGHHSSSIMVRYANDNTLLHFIRRSSYEHLRGHLLQRALRHETNTRNTCSRHS